MTVRITRKSQNAYHHGDLREALVQAALREAERGGPEAVSMSALARQLGVSQPAPYRHFADREALLAAITAEAFRQFSAGLRAAMNRSSKRTKLSRLARAALDFGLQRNGLYRLMFASRTMAAAAEGSELQVAAMETFDLVLEALGQPLEGKLRERHALTIWSGVHGAVMLAEQGILTGRSAGVGLDDLVEDMVAQTELALAHAVARMTA